MKFHPASLLLLLVLPCLSFAQKNAAPSDIIKRYERLVKEMKADSISQLFTIDAEVGHEGQAPIRGRDSIFQFLSTFKKVQVLSNVDSIATVSIRNDSAIVQGFYRQTVILPSNDTVHVSGGFSSSMIRDKNGWLIWKMHTRSL